MDQQPVYLDYEKLKHLKNSLKNESRNIKDIIGTNRVIIEGKIDRINRQWMLIPRILEKYCIELEINPKKGYGCIFINLYTKDIDFVRKLDKGKTIKTEGNIGIWRWIGYTMLHLRNKEWWKGEKFKLL